MNYQQDPPAYSPNTDYKQPSNTMSKRTPPLPPRHQDPSSSQGLGKVRALYDYDTGVDGDLLMYKGDIVVVVEKVNEDWWKGCVVVDDQVGMEVGSFPTNYVEVIDTRRASDEQRSVGRGYTEDKRGYSSDSDSYSVRETGYNPRVSSPGMSSRAMLMNGGAGGGSSSSYRSSPRPSSGFGGSLASGIQNHLNPRDPLNPPPPSWLREISSPCYPPFKPIHIFSIATKDLTPGLIPGSAPFPNGPSIPTHDVTPDDMSRFLEDLQIVTRLSAGNRIISNGVPLVLGMSFITGTLVTSKIDGVFKGPKTIAGCQLIEQWNVTFFQPRGLDVYLAQGTSRLSGPITGNSSQYVPFPNNSSNGMVGGANQMGMMNMGSSMGGMGGMGGMNQMMMNRGGGGLISSLMQAGTTGAAGAMQQFGNRRAMKDMQKQQEDQMKQMEKMQKDMMKGKGGGMMGMMGMNGMNGMMGMNGMNQGMMGNGGVGYNNGMMGGQMGGMGMGMGMGGNGVDATVLGPGAAIQNPMAYRLIIECLDQ